jgi:hypothetical protein
MRLIKELKKLEAVPFTHATLLSFLKGYKNPNDKIKEMVKKKEIIRIRRSLYILGDFYDNYFSKELIANSLYGPSYISIDYALSYYGLILERVYEVTSITTKTAKKYNTPIGRFTYVKSPVCLYKIGIDIKTTNRYSFMIATPTKALCDKLVFTKNLNIVSVKSMLEYLIDDLRMDIEKLKELDLETIQKCMECNYKARVLNFLYESIKKLKGIK